jgi:Na+-transporting NADH:ubiquinone oxidoreductase subunit C
MTAPGKTRERVWTVTFMFLVTLFSMSIVSALSLVTRERVERNASLFLCRAVLEAAGMEAPDNPADVLSRYSAAVTAVTNGPGPAYFRVADPGDRAPRSYVFVQTGSGLWGSITAVVGLRGDFSGLTGLTFTDQNETPGLGARITEDGFKAQFRGKKGPFRIVPEGAKSASPQEFDGITGASITTRAVQDIVNRVLAEGPARVTKGAP